MDLDRSSILEADRASALARWRAENGTGGLTDRALREAAVLAPIALSNGGLAFGDDFGELARFLDDMPF
jgi:hypothetical protein